VRWREKWQSRRRFCRGSRGKRWPPCGPCLRRGRNTGAGPVRGCEDSSRRCRVYCPPCCTL
jgi:hypothetical protein